MFVGMPANPVLDVGFHTSPSFVCWLSPSGLFICICHYLALCPGGAQFQAFIYKVVRRAGCIAPADDREAGGVCDVLPDEWDTVLSQYQLNQQLLGNRRETRSHTVISRANDAKLSFILPAAHNSGLLTALNVAQPSRKRATKQSAADVAKAELAGMAAAIAAVAAAIAADSATATVTAEVEPEEGAGAVDDQSAAQAVPAKEKRARVRRTCGECKTCKHPSLKKACIKKRSLEVAAALPGGAAAADTSAAAAAAAARTSSHKVCMPNTGEAAGNQASLSLGLQSSLGNPSKRPRTEDQQADGLDLGGSQLAGLAAAAAAAAGALDLTIVCINAQDGVSASMQLTGTSDAMQLVHARQHTPVIHNVTHPQGAEAATPAAATADISACGLGTGGSGVAHVCAARMPTPEDHRLPFRPPRTNLHQQAQRVDLGSAPCYFLAAAAQDVPGEQCAFEMMTGLEITLVDQAKVSAQGRLGAAVEGKRV